MQRQRHEHKIKQLQRKMRELEAREAAHLSPESEHLQEQQQGLDSIRQQLLCAAGMLTSFINQTINRSVTESQQVLCDPAPFTVNSSEL